MNERMALKVAISGKMRSGKDTLAQYLQSATGTPIDRFARPLKEGLEIMGCGDGEIIKDRKALQDIGQYFTRRDTHWWTRLMDERTPDRDKTGLIIPDLRRVSEFEWCEENGFLTVRLYVRPEVQIERGAEPETVYHETETELDGRLDDFDLIMDTEQHTVDEVAQFIYYEWGRKEHNDRLTHASV